jgi:hypothetical protein
MAVTKTTRPQRTPLANRSVLSVKGKEPGYTYRIVNDVGDRVDMFSERGYEVVSDNSVKIGDRRVSLPTKEGSPVQVSVGGGTKAFLMRIKDEWYKEDQDAKEAQLKDQERSMTNAPSTGTYGSVKIRND